MKIERLEAGEDKPLDLLNWVAAMAIMIGEEATFEMDPVKRLNKNTHVIVTVGLTKVYCTVEVDTVEDVWHAMYPEDDDE